MPDASVRFKNLLSQRLGDTEMTENEIGTVIVDCAVHLHQDLGPVLLESVYEVTLSRKLEKQGLRVERQVAVPIHYEGARFDVSCRPNRGRESHYRTEISRESESSP